MFQNCRGLPSPGLAKAPGRQMLRMTCLCWGGQTPAHSDAVARCYGRQPFLGGLLAQGLLGPSQGLLFLSTWSLHGPGTEVTGSSTCPETGTLS